MLDENTSHNYQVYVKWMRLIIYALASESNPMNKAIQLTCRHQTISLLVPSIVIMFQSLDIYAILFWIRNTPESPTVNYTRSVQTF